MNPNQPEVQTVTQQPIYSNLFSSFNVSLSTVSVICLLQKTESTCRHLKRELSEEIHRAQINCCHGYSTSECTCVKTADLQVNAWTAGILRHLCAADKNTNESRRDKCWPVVDVRYRSGLLSVLLVLLEARMLQRRLKNMTQGSVSASKPFSSQSELRRDKLFQDQSTLWFYLQTRLSTRGHCVSVSGLTHLHEGAVSSLFSSIVKKKNHKSEISWWKNVYSLKKIHFIFFHSSFF